MNDILAKGSASKLADFASSNVLLGFDYDGTLASIASRPRDARMRVTTRRLLAGVAQKYPCIVISGRAHSDLVKRVCGLPLWHIVGNHGLEPWAQTTETARAVRRWVQDLRTHLGSLSGVFVEDKTYSATVHYRHARGRAGVQRAIAAAVGRLTDVRAVNGDDAVNLIPRDGPDKGVALQRARRVTACDTAIYVGDDGTDEAAFASAPPARLLAVRIGRSRFSHAPYFVKTQREIDRFLGALLTLRGGSISPAQSQPAQPVL